MSGARMSVVVVICLSLALPVAALAADEHELVGSKNCKKCHIKEYRSWEETSMAQAFESLKPGVKAEAKKAAGLDPDADYTQDESCVACHVTGWGKPGGFTSIEETPELAGVGCESCHGPGGTYLEDGYMTLKNKAYDRAELVAVGLVAPVTREQCERCHNEESPFAPEGGFTWEGGDTEGLHEQYELKYEH